MKSELTQLSQLPIDEKAQTLVKREVYLCLSSWVTELLKLGEQCEWYDELLNLCFNDESYSDTLTDNGWTIAKVESHKLPTDEDQDYYIVFTPCKTGGYHVWSYEDSDLENNNVPGVARHNLTDYDRYHIPEDELEDVTESLCAMENLEPAYIEVFEFWAVSEMLARELAAEGHPVANICNTWLWGRPTTGQAIYGDGVIQRIADRVYSR